MSEQTRVWYLVPLRLFCGWVFLVSGLSKLSQGWLNHAQLQGVLQNWLRDGRPYAFYAPFLRDVVLPQAHTFSYLVSLGELTVGAALLAGLFTRLASLAGLVLVLNFMLGHGDGIGANNTAPFVAITLTLALTQPGRTLGLDAALKGKVPSWLS